MALIQTTISKLCRTPLLAVMLLLVLVCIIGLRYYSGPAWHTSVDDHNITTVSFRSLSEYPVVITHYRITLGDQSISTELEDRLPRHWDFAVYHQHDTLHITAYAYSTGQQEVRACYALPYQPGELLSITARGNSWFRLNGTSQVRLSPLAHKVSNP